MRKLRLNWLLCRAYLMFGQQFSRVMDKLTYFAFIDFYMSFNSFSAIIPNVLNILWTVLEFSNANTIIFCLLAKVFLKYENGYIC